MHYYKFNIHDWQSSTRHLTPAEEGVYFRLINYYYDTESPIPLETQSVIRRLSLGSYSDLVMSILDEFFIKTSKGYEKQKCNDVIKEYKKTAKKNKSNGMKGGRPRKIKVSSETQEKPSGLPVETQSEPTGNPNQEPLTINQEPLTNTNHQSEIDAMFDRFWLSGIRKVEKKKAKQKFTKLLSEKTQKQKFTDYLVNDIQWRITNNQLGFTEMHPTTYLNGERWTDERRQVQAGQRKASLSERAAEQTRQLFAQCEAEEAGSGAMGQNDTTLPPQMGEFGRPEDERGRTVNGEFHAVVPKNRGFER